MTVVSDDNDDGDDDDLLASSLRNENVRGCGNPENGYLLCHDDVSV